MQKIQSFTRITSHAQLPVPIIIHRPLPQRSFKYVSSCFLLFFSSITFLFSFMMLHFSHIWQVINGSFEHTILPLQLVVCFPSTNLPISLLLEIPCAIFGHSTDAFFCLSKCFQLIYISFVDFFKYSLDELCN